MYQAGRIPWQFSRKMKKIREGSTDFNDLEQFELINRRQKTKEAKKTIQFIIDSPHMTA